MTTSPEHPTPTPGQDLSAGQNLALLRQGYVAIRSILEAGTCPECLGGVCLTCEGTGHGAYGSCDTCDGSGEAPHVPQCDTWAFYKATHAMFGGGK